MRRGVADGSMAPRYGKNSYRRVTHAPRGHAVLGRCPDAAGTVPGCPPPCLRRAERVPSPEQPPPSEVAAGAAGGEQPGSIQRLRLLAVSLGLLLLTFAQNAGDTAADTKLDLVIDPARFLGRSLRLWDPNGSAGQLQDQAYGYLFPMGPFFLLGKLAQLPPWVMQRSWESVLLIAAFLGVVRLARLLGVAGFWPRVAAGLAYALAPRMLTELFSISSELLPVAVLPWVLIPLVRGSQAGSPRGRRPGPGVALLFAGGINASATLAILPVPALWLLTRPRGPRRAALLRWWLLAVLLSSLWWAVPLLVLGRYSPPFLDWIESAAVTTSQNSLVASLRGVDHWQAYLGPQVWPAGWVLVVVPAAIAATVAVAALGLAGLARFPARHRAFLLLTLLLGLVLVTMGHRSTVGPAVRRHRAGPAGRPGQPVPQRAQVRPADPAAAGARVRPVAGRPAAGPGPGAAPDGAEPGLAPAAGGAGGAGTGRDSDRAGVRRPDGAAAAGRRGTRLVGAGRPLAGGALRRRPGAGGARRRPAEHGVGPDRRRPAATGGPQPVDGARRAAAGPAGLHPVPRLGRGDPGPGRAQRHPGPAAGPGRGASTCWSATTWTPRWPTPPGWALCTPPSTTRRDCSEVQGFGVDFGVSPIPGSLVDGGTLVRRAGRPDLRGGRLPGSGRPAGPGPDGGRPGSSADALATLAERGVGLGPRCCSARRPRPPVRQPTTVATDGIRRREIVFGNPGQDAATLDAQTPYVAARAAHDYLPELAGPAVHHRPARAGLAPGVLVRSRSHRRDQPLGGQRPVRGGGRRPRTRPGRPAASAARWGSGCRSASTGRWTRPVRRWPSRPASATSRPGSALRPTPGRWIPTSPLTPACSR